MSANEPVPLDRMSHAELLETARELLTVCQRQQETNREQEDQITDLEREIDGLIANPPPTEAREVVGHDLYPLIEADQGPEGMTTGVVTGLHYSPHGTEVRIEFDKLSLAEAALAYRPGRRVMLGLGEVLHGC